MLFSVLIITRFIPDYIYNTSKFLDEAFLDFILAVAFFFVCTSVFYLAYEYNRMEYDRLGYDPLKNYRTLVNIIVVIAVALAFAVYVIYRPMIPEPSDEGFLFSLNQVY